MALRTISADVLWWDSSDVHVKCPFCGKIHRHGFEQNYNSVHCVSHCEKSAESRSYSFKYPFSHKPGWTAYEIDKSSKRYVALGASQPEPEQDLLVGAFAGMELEQKPTITLPSWGDATETVIIDKSDPILKDDADDQSPPAANGIIENQFLFRKSPNGDRIRLYALVAEYELPTPYKTIACLKRGGRYPSIAAMSGWSHGKTTPLVSGKDWTSEVIRIAKIIGHALIPDNNKDNGDPGKYHACHAEKQLIAYFISKHVFLEPETRAPEKPFESPDTYCPGDDESKEGGTLHELAANAPPVSLKQARILVSSPLCDDCKCFIDVVNAKLDLRISVENPCVLD